LPSHHLLGEWGSWMYRDRKPPNGIAQVHI
jgi:hypothetical protein